MSKDKMMPENNFRPSSLIRQARAWLRPARARVTEQVWTIRQFPHRLRYGLAYAVNRPAPRAVKVRTVQSYGREYEAKCLVETGTYQGDMVAACLPFFDRIVSIEIFKPLYEDACERFASQPRVTLLQGDSGHLLPKILADLSEPCVFWLDGHYSGPGTGRGSVDTPILAELSCIFSHSQKGHVILIDDARHFVGRDGYPKAHAVRRLATEAGRKFRREQDIIRITPT